MRRTLAWTAPWRDAAVAWRDASDAVAAGGAGRRRWAGIALSTLAAWWLYVPAHELMHALGCAVAGGRVDEVEIAVLYGGRLWARILPFVRAGGEHAGRLSAFDVRGSDLIFLVTDLAPYVLTVLAAFPLLRAARRRRSPLLLGPGTVLVAAPALSVTGDYYEIGSIMVSRALALLLGRPVDGPLQRLRHDDLVALLAEGSGRSHGGGWRWGAAVLASAAVGLLAASLTLLAARRCGDALAAARSGARRRRGR